VLQEMDVLVLHCSLMNLSILQGCSDQIVVIMALALSIRVKLPTLLV
jgi:hypothetical protein